MQDKEELPFVAGEVLTLLRKDNEDWWTMQNSRGVVGTVPVKLIDRVRQIIHSVFLRVKNSVLACLYNKKSHAQLNIL